jgi:flavin-dependent dehydrogenase
MEIISTSGSSLFLAYGSDESTRTASVVPRDVLDTALVEEAIRRGVELLDGHTAHTPVWGEGRVRGVRVSVAGKLRKFPAHLVVVADGARSIIARSLGLASPPRWPVRLGLVAHYAGQAQLHAGFGQMHVRKDGYCGVAPLPDGRLNVAMVVPVQAPLKARRSPTEFFEDWIRSTPRLSDTLSACRRVDAVRGVSPIGARARRAWTPGALLVGDAAGFFDPFTGEGIYRAMRGAELAAAVSQMALEAGDFSNAALASYGALRGDAFSHKQAVTALVQVFVRYPMLLNYVAPRLAARRETAGKLAGILGDLTDAREFFRPPFLWSVFRP